jgi:protein-S-isoprenylcysteine O-methyltransferase Ste14
MPEYFAALTMLLLIGMVVTRARLLKSKGIDAMQFGKIDRKDFLLPPFALFYIYLIFAHAFHLPTVSTSEMFQVDVLRWIGVLFCLVGLGLFLVALVSFGNSFRVGIDTEHPDKLITSSIFAQTRNPIYVAFALVLLGQFLVFPNWILLLYLGAAVAMFHRQVLREEEFLKKYYGQEYADYCQRVRRYF